MTPHVKSKHLYLQILMPCTFWVLKRQDYAINNHWSTVYPPLVEILLRRALSVTPLRNLPVNKRLRYLTWVFHFSSGIHGQVWYLIVSIASWSLHSYLLRKFVWYHVIAKSPSYVHKNLFAPQTPVLLEKLALFFSLQLSSRTQCATIKNKRLSPIINVENIKTWGGGCFVFRSPLAFTIIKIAMIFII